MIWLDASDPEVRAAVQTGKWGSAPAVPDLPDPGSSVDTIEVALQVASEILTQLTAFKVHPGGESVEEFVAHPGTYRLTPNYLPIRSVTSLERVSDTDCELLESTEPFCIFGQSVYFTRNRQLDYGAWRYRSFGCRVSDTEFLRLTYKFGSTITATARRAVVYFAHQLLLEAQGEECELPARTMTINREGIQYAMMDPQDFLARGKTGIPSIDLWLAATNPRRALRPARVITPDSPAASGLAVRTIRA
jgi:hypothetical protein